MTTTKHTALRLCLDCGAEIFDEPTGYCIECQSDDDERKERRLDAREDW